MSLHRSSALLDRGKVADAFPGEDLAPARRPLAAAIARLAACEFLIVAVAAYLAGLVYHGLLLGTLPNSVLYIAAALFAGAAVELTSLGFGHYKESQSQSWHAFLFGGFGAVALAFSFLLSALFLFKLSGQYSRATFVFQFVVVEIAVLTTRAVFHARLRAAIAAGRVNARRVVLIGEAACRATFAGRLRATAIQTVGSFPFPPQGHPSSGDTHEGAGDRSPSAGSQVQTLSPSGSQAPSEIQALLGGCRRLKPDDILILAKQDDISQLSRLIRWLSEMPAGLHVVPVEAAAVLASARTVEFGNVVTMQVLRPPLSGVQRFAKRLFDLAAGLAGLVILLPLFAAVAIAIKLDSRGPVLFRQTRHGYNNEIIKIFKFRSMVHHDDGGAFVQAVKDDSRVTRVGAFLRRANIDELPQLFNVVRGEMSIVGPRPHATNHNQLFEGKILVFSRRHVVKPGITGWAQVHGLRGPTDTLEKMQQRVDHDLYYIDHWSFWLDMRIILMTVFSKTAYQNAY